MIAPKTIEAVEQIYAFANELGVCGDAVIASPQADSLVFKPSPSPVTVLYPLPQDGVVLPVLTSF